MVKKKKGIINKLFTKLDKKLEKKSKIKKCCSCKNSKDRKC
jgi:hypothetical protein